MIKIIACDLDETLLNDQRQLNPIDQTTIKKIRQKDIRFVLASGRPYKGLEHLVKALQLDDQPNEYVLALNGAMIVETKSKKILQTASIPYEHVIQLLQFGLEHHVCVQIYTTDTCYAYNFDEEEKEIFAQEHIPYVEILDQSIEFLKNVSVLKVLFERRDLAYLKSLEPLMGTLKEGLTISYSSYRYMEINSHKADKGSGLKELAKLLDIDLSDTMAIGDNYNDASMIQTAGIGVAVQNSLDDIKKIADYVTSSTNNEGAVSEAINKFIQVE